MMKNVIFGNFFGDFNMDIGIGITIGILLCWISEMIQSNAIKKYIEKTVRKEMEEWINQNQKNL